MTNRRGPPPILAPAYALAFSAGGIQLSLTSTAMDKVGLSMSAVGAMWAARSVLAIVGPAVWGILADKRGDARPFAAASLFSGTIICAVLAMTTSSTPAWIAIVCYGLYGLLTAPVGSLLDGMTLTALGDDKHHKFGRWRMWGTVGFGVTALAATLLVDRGVVEALPLPLFGASAVLLFIGGVFPALMPRLPRQKLGRLRDVLPVLRRGDMIALFVVSTLLWCSHVGYSSFLMVLATSHGRALPEWSVGLSMAAGIVVEVVMLREAGRVTARFGARNVLVFCAGLTVVRWALSALVTSPALFIALNAVHGITFGLFYATVVGLVAAKTPPQMRQAAQGVVASSAFGLGGAIGSLMCGALIERTDSMTTWWALAGVALVAFAVAVRTVR